VVRFWDSSALIARFIEEPQSAMARRWYRDDSAVVVWVMTRVEIASAIARRRREEPSLASEFDQTFRDIVKVSEEWIAITDHLAVRDHAERIVRSHPLRAADALQLGAAIAAAEEEPASLEFVTLDRRLAEAAIREGFQVLGPR
jgi:uncharacterized protein